MCKVIAIANQKGGVGKTVTTVNLGCGLARQGKKVLVIDSDSQGSLSISLGIQSPDKLDKSLANVIANVINEEEFDISEYIVPAKEFSDAPLWGEDNFVNGAPLWGEVDFVDDVPLWGEVDRANCPPLWGEVDLLPGNIELSAVEVSLVGAFSRENVLKQIIEKVKDKYDYILIDCMPSLGMLTINALTSADSVLIPVQASYLPVKGFQQLISTIGRIKRQLNPKLEIEGVLFTMVDVRANLPKNVMAQLIEAYSSKIRFFKNYIPMSIRLSESSINGSDIYEYEPNSKVATAYRMLVQEVH